jgi:LDH2 family malate/lactate/ureidoglycolate dehydrogenase
MAAVSGATGQSPVRAASKAGPAGDPGERPRMVAPGELSVFARRILEGLGTPAAAAAAVAESLVASDLAGHDPHGVRRLLPYSEFVRAGQVDPAAEPSLAEPSGATAVVDGNRCFGQLAATLATDTVARLAREHGAAAVAVRRSGHVGRLGEYTGALAEGDLVGLAVCNSDPTVAPHGGRERRLGTNPLSLAVPRAAGEPPIVLDWATSAVAEGKLQMSLARGEQAPAGAIVDADGRPSTEPSDFYEGGALLPFGAHKGYALSVLIELLGGLLSGAGISSLPGYDETNGMLVVALEIGRFGDPEQFRERAEAFCGLLAATPPAEGAAGVLVPGEPEARVAAERRRDGVPVPAAIWRALEELLDSTGREQQ